MTRNRPTPVIVLLSDDDLERRAAEIVAHYSRGEDREACLPWSRNEFTTDYLREWLASRKEAGREIDIETCEVGCWYAYDLDPYGLDPDLPEELQQIGRNRFVRSAESQGSASG